MFTPRHLSMLSARQLAKTTAMTALTFGTALLATILGCCCLCGGIFVVSGNFGNSFGLVAGGIILAIGLFATWNGIALLVAGFQHFRRQEESGTPADRNALPQATLPCTLG